MSTNEQDVPVEERVSVQDAKQLAQQAVQKADEAIQQASQAVQAAQQAARAVGAETSSASVQTELSPASQGLAWAANFKRTYDEFQDISLVAARRSQSDFDGIRNVSLQALQNAVESANMLGKQAIAHRDIAIDREWNIDEVAGLVAAMGRTDVFKEAIEAAVARSVQSKE